MPDIKTVWIEECCIGCHVCVGTAPEVFAMTAARAVILGPVRLDGVTSFNDDERTDLNAEGRESSPGIHEAAAGCPVEAIRFTSIS